MYNEGKAKKVNLTFLLKKSLGGPQKKPLDYFITFGKVKKVCLGSLFPPNPKPYLV